MLLPPLLEQLTQGGRSLIRPKSATGFAQPGHGGSTPPSATTAPGLPFARIRAAECAPQCRTSSPGPTSRIYFSQRLRLHYVDWGNAEAPPLVLVHGGRDHCRNWDWVAGELRRDWHVIAPDLRGHGDSEWSKDGTYMMAGYVYDLAQLIHQQKLAPVTIIAHSLGGNIALRYAGLYPENVAKLIAIEGLGPSPKMLAERFATGFADRMRAWIDEQRGLSGPPAAPLRHASRTPGSACRRRTSTCRPSRRGISRSTASTRTRTAPTAGSSTTTCAPGRPTT